MKRRKLPVIALVLFLSIYNFYRIKGDENIRAVQFLTIFAIGALSAILLESIIKIIKERMK